MNTADRKLAHYTIEIREYDAMDLVVPLPEFTQAEMDDWKKQSEGKTRFDVRISDCLERAGVQGPLMGDDTERAIGMAMTIGKVQSLILGKMIKQKQNER